MRTPSRVPVSSATRLTSAGTQAWQPAGAGDNYPDPRRRVAGRAPVDCLPPGSATPGSATCSSAPLDMRYAKNVWSGVPSIQATAWNGCSLRTPPTPRQPSVPRGLMSRRGFSEPWSPSNGQQSQTPRMASDPRGSPRNDDVLNVVSPGDVLYVKGTGGLANLGTTGGFAGHVLLALSQPFRIDLDSAEAQELPDNVWPQLKTPVNEIWSVRTMESTRRAAGIHVSDLLFCVDPVTRDILIVGDRSVDREDYGVADLERIEVWQSPQRFRSDLRVDFMADVVEEMRGRSSSWSITTAARAIFYSAAAFNNTNRALLLDELRACWGKDPICTSVIIVFWQMYLCKIAEETGQRAIDYIMQLMPLKSDRVLPGELLSSMKLCGWTNTCRVS